MGTRGFLGFVIDGTEKIAYSHFDSYPSGLGNDVLSWLRDQLAKDQEDGLKGMGLALILAQARALRVVDPNSTPTAEDIEKLKGYANLNVGEQNVEDWYVLLRETQGNPAAMLQAGCIEDGGQFPLDSLFAEYGYLVDLDAKRFEAYRGFQAQPHSKGRFAAREQVKYSGCEYWPCALVASWPLDELPTEDEFYAAFGTDGDNE